MTITPDRATAVSTGERTMLPIAAHARGKRSPVTCRLKCADACDRPECNTSGNPTFRSIAAAAFSRRSLFGGAAAGALTIAAASGTSGSAAASPGPGGLPFDPIAPVDATIDAVVVPNGYRWQPLIRWGDPLFADAPIFDIGAQSAAAQARQFGYNNDYLDILVDPSGLTGVLVANHEYVNPAIMFPPSDDPAELRRRGEIFQAAQGLSVVEVVRDSVGAPWRTVVGGARNRRITVTTPFAVEGPARGSSLLRTAADPGGRVVLGTLGNCAGGTTPWGTILSGEENFNGYFVASASSPERARYGFSESPTSTGWETWDSRFDARAAGSENEPNRFGWIVEIDPQDPTSTPVKHTAMGRFKHEGANVRVDDDGRVVAYMGDDERGDYLYKFVSRFRMDRGVGQAARRNNRRLLTEGDLFVARFSGDSPAAEIDGSGRLPSDGAFDGVGEWIPLTRGRASAVPGMTLDEVLVHTRLAADAVGATKMDRCEDVEPHPTTGRVYIACTNNTQRGTAVPVDEANPRLANRDGHVIELEEEQGAGGRTFRWSILLLCGDPAGAALTYFAGFPADRVSPISCPDNVAFDSEGNLWISTDGAPSTIRRNDGLFKVPLEGAERGRVQQFLSVPRDAEVCGPVIRNAEGMVLVAVQHPGEDGAWDAPTSLFPDYGVPGPGQAPAAPRPSVMQVWRG
ncbi:PhoX family phosphatase [Microcella daejeonensis]|uniref:PhoX family phosphatase n=1 Tax=Microcella daejeonensis TaxID=2994971 RepID=A0A9E8SAU9_9MICO|nr:PhoX family phosphatase [Microcella daejeonensis]WAB80992.1 PhoX family phosphatase [Microcella daejeonensis]